jgi:hypothetical protein
VRVIQSKSKKTTKIKSEADLLSEATSRLLKGIKEHTRKQGKSLNREELLRRGYDKKFIAKLEAA